MKRKTKTFLSQLSPLQAADLLYLMESLLTLGELNLMRKKLLRSIAEQTNKSFGENFITYEELKEAKDITDLSAILKKKELSPKLKKLIEG